MAVARPESERQPHSPADEALVAAARGGSVDAFAALVRRYEPPVLRFLYHETGDASLAADLTQETFLAAYRAIDGLRDDHAFAPWLYRIARNTLRMERRQRGNERALSLDWLASKAGIILPALQRQDDSVRQGEHDVIQQVLDGLSPALREALLLHSLWGFSGPEIAGLLGISTSAARKRIGRAQAQFRERHTALMRDILPGTGTDTATNTDTDTGDTDDHCL